ncbi:MAG TPA: YfhO family protein, partial [Isosphaeraceae bacterium]|nr:YfhO family protein [Isosphaeraceae bacterium]
MNHESPRTAPAFLMAILAVAITLGGLLVGYEPVSGDPDRMYRPIKSELARALRAGQLPFWSDRFGLGTPLVAESHVAAFYPLNILLYRSLEVSPAYRLAMWLHYVALAAATYAYARTLGILPWGSALAAVSFTFCGFQAIHASHEPFYHALVYLPLALLATERFMAGGSPGWLAVLALAWGAQLTVGHFQIQAWTAALVLFTGFWRKLEKRASWWRGLGLAGALAWGAAIAIVQLAQSAEMAMHVPSNRRALSQIASFGYPPQHWAELVAPLLFHDLKGGPEGAYWMSIGTTNYEACFYVGTITLVLALVGLAASR